MPDPYLVHHPRVYDDVEPILKFRTVKKWADSRKPGSGRKSAVYHMAAYIRWRKKRGLSGDPDSWIEECVNGTNKTLIEHLKPLKDWVEGPEFDGSDPDTRSKHYSDIRGFYAHHLVPLPRSKLNGRTVRATRVRKETTTTDFLQMMQKVLEGEVRPRDRSIMLSMLQGGMDASTLTESFNFLAYPQFVNHFGTEDWTRWDEDKVPVRMNLVRPKTDYQYYTFQGRDAISALKSWLNVRRSLWGEIKVKRPANPRMPATSDPIFLTDYGAAVAARYITNLFERYGVKSGVNVKSGKKVQPFKGASRRYPFRSHECRDTLVTLARRAKVDLPAASFFIGRNIDTYHYDRSPQDDPDWFEEQYLRLMPYLNIVSQKETVMKEKIERGFGGRLKSLEAENLSLKGRLAELERIQKSDRQRAEQLQKALEDFESLRRETRRMKRASRGLR
jgi:site-specific recombinase XerC